MKRLVVTLLSLMVLLGAAVPASASAAPGPPPDVTPPLFLDNNWNTVPAGFTATPNQAIAAAKRSPKMQAIHRAHHPLQIQVYEWVRSHYEIFFYYDGKVIADQIVHTNGKIGPTYTGPLIQASYARGGYGQIFDSPWVLGPFTAMFLLPLLLLRGRRWLDPLRPVM